MSQYILERSGMDEKVFKRNKAKDWYLDHDEQVKYGLVHSVVASLDVVI